MPAKFHGQKGIKQRNCNYFADKEIRSKITEFNEA